MTVPDPAQFRAARVMLGWSKLDLVKAASVSVSAVMRAEGGGLETLPSGTAGAIRVALETAGVRFVEDQGEGAGVLYKPVGSRRQ